MIASTHRGIIGLAVVATMVIPLGGCSAPGTTASPPTRPGLVVVGTVLSIDGDLGSTTGFELLSDGGERLTFEPAEGATFHDGPISHLRDHLVSGVPVRVEYTVGPGDSLIATYVEDADHGR